MKTHTSFNHFIDKIEYHECLLELCNNAKMNGFASLDRYSKDIIYRIVVVPENIVKDRSHSYHECYIPRSFVIDYESCYLVSIEYWELTQLLSRTALYIFCTLENYVFYGENMMGEDCYWDDELEKRLSVIIK